MKLLTSKALIKPVVATLGALSLMTTVANAETTLIKGAKHHRVF